MHQKDFARWNVLKQLIDADEKRPNVSAREIRWCSLGHNIGSEIDGKGTAFARPVLVLRFISTNTCLVLPLTHSEKTGNFIHSFDFKGEIIKGRLDQIRIVDRKRLKNKIGTVSEKKFEEIVLICKEFLFGEKRK